MRRQDANYFDLMAYHSNESFTPKAEVVWAKKQNGTKTNVLVTNINLLIKAGCEKNKTAQNL